MEASTILIQLVLILFAARFLGEVAAYFKAPSVIGELLAGIIIGPSLLGIVETNDFIKILAEIGIILLLFEVGLETNVVHLTAAGVKAAVVAIGGVILPFAFGFLVSFYFFDFTLLGSLFIACTLTATSIGITLRVMQDLKKQNSHEAQIIIGAAVLDDVIGIVLLAMLYEFATSGVVSSWNAGKVLIFIALFFVLAPLLAKAISTIIKKWNHRSEIPGLLPTTIVALILFFAWLAHELGAPELLGGFAAGLALSKQFYFSSTRLLEESQDFTHDVEVQMKPIIHLFTPIFFVAIGLSLNLQTVNWNSSFIWILSITLLIAAILGKLLAPMILRKESWMKKLTIGTAMIPRGEVGLIFANVGQEAGVLKDDTYTAIILVIALTTLLAPFALRYLYMRKVPI